MTDMKTLVGKLNPVCRRATEKAAQLCVKNTNFNVEIEHLLLCLLDESETDLAALLRYYEIDEAAVRRELSRSMEKFQRGNTRTPALSPHLLDLLEEAWVMASLDYGLSAVRSGTLLVGLLRRENLRSLMIESAPPLLKLPYKALEDIREIMRQTGEERGAATASSEEKASLAGGRRGGPAAPTPTPALDQYTIDLTAEAEGGRIDPIRGRDNEIRQVIDILMRRRQNNPILTGEAGVGKTAVVEGFALRVSLGDVPPALKDIAVRTLDLGLLQAGAGVRGEFEERLKTVIEEVKSSPRPIILFIDEAHTMIGAGGPAGQNDAANLLKPALARGELRTIAATTWSEYKKHFEKDPALTRRFQVVQVKEPDEEVAAEMLRGVAGKLEEHHGVRILEEAVHAAVTLSHRYITGRQLPDKAVSVLDTASARVALAHSGTPPRVEAVAREIDRLNAEIDVLKREQVAGIDHDARLEELGAELSEGERRWAEIDGRWQEEMALVKQINEAWTELEDRSEQRIRSTREEIERQSAHYASLKDELAELQGEDPLVPVCVDEAQVATVVSSMTGIPVGRMVTDEIRAVLALRDNLMQRVVGQDQALEVISRRIRTYRATLDEPGKPVGVFLLVGPSGVGKTETAVALSELLSGGERAMITINMSEYQEAHTVSGLKGAPPGYVGYGTGGVLTEAVKRNPYSVVLLDEVEKAHADVMELFYQVFDKGTLEDGEGQTIDFKNTIILLTSNVGSEEIMAACGDGQRPEVDVLGEAIRPHLVRQFKAALLGRMVVVPYYPLGEAEMRSIVELKLAKIVRRFEENHMASLTYDAAILDDVVSRCTEAETGARNIDNILTNALLPELAAEVLQRMADGVDFGAVHVSLNASGGFEFAFSADGEG